MSKVLNTVFMIVGYMKGTDELSYWSDELSYLSIDNHSGDPYWSWFGGKEFKTLAEAARVLKQECNADSYMHKAVSKIELIKVQTIAEVISTEQVIAEARETAEREAYEAAQRKEDANREKWRAEMRRDVYGEPN